MAHILVIDDEKIVRDLFRNLLEGTGHEVAEAPDGEAGLAAFRSAPPDLTIIDILMPVKGGLEVIEEIRRDHPGAKILAIAAYSDRMLPEAEKAGANRSLPKPFLVQDLLDIVEDLLAE